MQKMVVALLLVLACGTAFGQDYAGVLNNAPYKIRVPANWNGELLMYAHGYGYLERWNPATQFDYSYADAAPGGQVMEDFLLSQGYALAGTVFNGTGWQVKEGIHNLVSLVGFFNGLVGKPKRTVLIGYSLGSLIAFKSAEDIPLYDGIIAGCDQGAGTSKGMGLAGDFSLAYATLFNWPSAWGTWYDIKNDIKFYEDVYPVLLPQITNLQNFPKFEFMRLLVGMPLQGAYENPGWMFLGMFMATEARADIQSRASGPVVQNANHFYSLTDAQKTYLMSLGMPKGTIDNVLATMNAQTNVTVAPRQKRYLGKYFDPTGDLRRPLITMHETGDGLVGVFNETVLADTMKAAGGEDLLVQTFTNGSWHCGFSAPQLLSTIKAMDFWLDTGTKPGPGFFPETLGFVPGYAPPQWPIGTK